MTPVQRQFMIAFTIGAAAAVAVADQPYQRSFPVEAAGNRSNARLITSARQHPAIHPEVAVDRSLAAQPVHPWMAKVQVSGNVLGVGADRDTVKGPITTYIDPINDLTAQGMDDNHSFVRAQRLHRSMIGMSTRDLNELRHRAHQATQARIGGSKVRVLRAPQYTEAGDHAPHAAEARQSPRPIMIIPKKRLEVEEHPGGHIEIRTVPEAGPDRQPDGAPGSGEQLMAAR